MTSYRQYLEIPEADREKQFQAFCKKHKRNPITDDQVGDDFIDSIVDTDEDEDDTAKKTKSK
jgi:hypothetical protein